MFSIQKSISTIDVKKYWVSDWNCQLPGSIYRFQLPVNDILTLLLLVPFSYKLVHHLKPFAIVVLNGEITVYSVDSPNGFEW